MYYILQHTVSVKHVMFSECTGCCDSNDQANFREDGCVFPEDRCQHRWNGTVTAPLNFIG